MQLELPVQTYRLIAGSTDVEALEDDVVIARIPDSPTSERAQYNDWLAAGNTPLPALPPPPAVVPPIAKRQFYQQLAVDGLITEDEALAATEGVLPPTLNTAIATFPADQQFGAKMYFKGSQVFERGNAYIVALAGYFGWSAEQTDAFFVRAAAL